MQSILLFSLILLVFVTAVILLVTNEKSEKYIWNEVTNPNYPLFSDCGQAGSGAWYNLAGNGNKNNNYCRLVQNEMKCASPGHTMDDQYLDIDSQLLQNPTQNNIIPLNKNITDLGYSDNGYYSTRTAFYDFDGTGKFNYFCRPVEKFNFDMKCANNDTITSPADQYQDPPTNINWWQEAKVQYCAMAK